MRIKYFHQQHQRKSMKCLELILQANILEQLRLKLFQFCLRNHLGGCICDYNSG